MEKLQMQRQEAGAEAKTQQLHCTEFTKLPKLKQLDD
jgi:hypothetical protein